jgi:hypothetical protein
MAESGHSGIAASAVAFDPAAEIAALRSKGADRIDPVRFHFIESLSARTLQQQGKVKRLLEGKLAAALAAYWARFEQAQSDARETSARVSAQFPAAAEDLQRHLTAGDFKALRQLVARLEKNETPPPLAELMRHLAQHAPEGIDGDPGGEFGARAELKTIRHFRNTWAKLSVDKQLAQAIEQAPENAGPINSHRLVLRSLALMRDISPDYLNRFMSYADTLLWLDQADNKNKPIVKKLVTAKVKKK